MLVDEFAGEAYPYGKKGLVDFLVPGVNIGTKRAEVEAGSQVYFCMHVMYIVHGVGCGLETVVVWLYHID